MSQSYSFLNFKNIVFVFILSIFFSCQKESDSSSVGVKRENENISTSSNKPLDPSNQQPKLYVALLTQSGTSHPVANIQINNVGNIVWTRSVAGVYNGVLNNGFSAGKVALLMGNTGLLQRFYVSDPSRITIALTLPDFSGQDDRLNETVVRIEIYP